MEEIIDLKIIYYGKTIRLPYFSRQLKGQTKNEALTTRLITRLITDYKEKITFELNRYLDLFMSFHKKLTYNKITFISLLFGVFNE